MWLCFTLALSVVDGRSAFAQHAPGPWGGADIGSPAVAGRSSSTDGRTFQISAGGYDIWNGYDEFHFVYQAVTGDAEIVARVDSVGAAHAWSKAGVMIRSSLAANAAHGFALVSAGRGLAFQRRTSTGEASTNTAGPAAVAPHWVRLSREGTTVTAAVSTDGLNWTTVGTDTIALETTAYIGLAVTSHNTTAATDAAISEVTITQQSSGPASPALPEPFLNGDVGSPALVGHARHSGGVFSVAGAGADIWGTADQFQYVYQQVTGDLDVRARVVSIDYLHRWSKAGVMIRESLAPGSRHAYALMSAGAGNAFQRRVDPSGLSSNTAGWAVGAPGWVRLVRTADQIEAFQSADGSNWTLIGSEVIPMGSTVYVGLAVTSHHEGATSEAVFDNVDVDAGTPPANTPPAVSMTSPAEGTSFVAPASFTVSADASDADGTIARVEFLRDGVVIATDTTAPYQATVSGLEAGAYTFTARAFDDDDVSTVSAAATVTVTAAPPPPPRAVAFTASADHVDGVTRYVLEIFAAGADPATATPLATSDLGKPAPDTANDITVDRSEFFSTLAAGDYLAVVRAEGSGGSSRSAAVAFTR